MIKIKYITEVMKKKKKAVVFLKWEIVGNTNKVKVPIYLRNQDKLDHNSDKN